jgi:outer membrane protein TolC
MKRSKLRFNRYTGILLLIFILYFSPCSLSQDKLQYYLDSAIKSSPALRENDNNIQIKKLDILFNKAQYSAPQISLTANYLFAPYFSGGKLITTNPDPSAIGYDASITNGGLYSAQLNISQNLLYSKTIHVNNSHTDLQLKSYEENAGLIRHELIKDVTEQYLNAYQAQELYSLSLVILDTLLHQLQITQSLMEKGLTKQADYLLLKIEAGNKEIDVRSNYTAWKSSLSQLNTLCGISDTALIVLSSAGLNISGRPDESNFIRQYNSDSMQVLLQQEVLETKYLPQLNAFVNAGLNAVEWTNIQKKFGISAGLNFSLPIFDGKQKDITRQQTQVSLGTISNYKNSKLLLIGNKRAESFIQMKGFEKNLSSIKEQIKDYRNILTLCRSELLSGQLSMPGFLTFINNYQELKKSELSAFINYQQSINQFNYWNW